MRRIGLLAVIWSSGLTALPAVAGPICKTLESTLDYIICSDDALIVTYGALDEAEAKAGAGLDKEQRHRLRQEDTTWWREFGRPCGVTGVGQPSDTLIAESKACVLQQMKDRITVLSERVP